MGQGLSLLSTDIPRSLVLGEWTKIIPFVARAGKMCWEALDISINFLEILQNKSQIKEN